MTAPPPYEDYCDHFSPLQVEITSSFEEGLRRFKSMVQRDKILVLYKDKQHYEKPSEKNRRKRRERDERRKLNSIREKLIASGEWDRRQKARDQKKKERYQKRKPSDNNYD